VDQQVKFTDVSTINKNVLYGDVFIYNMQLVNVQLANDKDIQEVIVEFKKPSGQILKTYLMKDTSLLSQYLAKAKQSSL